MYMTVRKSNVYLRYVPGKGRFNGGRQLQPVNHKPAVGEPKCGDEACRVETLILRRFALYAEAALGVRVWVSECDLTADGSLGPDGLAAQLLSPIFTLATKWSAVWCCHDGRVMSQFPPRLLFFFLLLFASLPFVFELPTGPPALCLIYCFTTFSTLPTSCLGCLM